ncbi:MAG TPA: sugar transferase [Gaiellaceae bacterium]|nr:sugar transferase [Gaiellaceae bacterium]
MNSTGVESALPARAEATRHVLERLDSTVRRQLAGSEGASGRPRSDRLWADLAASLPPPRAHGRASLALKRLADVVVASLLLVLAAPLLAAAALAVLLETGRPAFFVHERLTRGRERFDCRKLRTMRPEVSPALHADPDAWATYAREDFKIRDPDPRITRVGSLLRRGYLDELPQLWNVLRGEMSMIGPRPIIPAELVWYGPLADELLHVRPGLSGIWQLTDHLPYPGRSYVELAYARGWSLRCDLAIALRTLVAVATRREIPIGSLLERLGADASVVAGERRQPAGPSALELLPAPENAVGAGTDA